MGPQGGGALTQLRHPFLDGCALSGLRGLHPPTAPNPSMGAICDYNSDFMATVAAVCDRRRFPGCRIAGGHRPPLQLIPASSVEKSSQPAAAARMTEFSKSFGFDLADTFAGNGKVLTDFFQRMFGAVFQSEAHFNHAF